MEIDGIALTFLDIPAELTQEYNRWYDLDHMPEHVSKADVLMGRHVHPRSLRSLPGLLSSEEFGDQAPYATIYFHGGPLDFTSPEARDLWRAMDHIIVRAGRYWRDGRAKSGGRFWLGESFTKPGVHVSAPAVPYINHRGVIFAYGRPSSPDEREAAQAWWRDTHLPRPFRGARCVCSVALRPSGRGSQRRHHAVHDHVRRASGRCDGRHRGLQALHQGHRRFPAHKGVYEPIAFLTDRIVPFEYDFDFGTDESWSRSLGRCAQRTGGSSRWVRNWGLRCGIAQPVGA